MPNESVTIIGFQDGPTPVIEVVQAPVTVIEVSGIPVPQAAETGALEAHIQSVTPHPHYDDLPSLSLLFENGLI